MMGLFMIKIVDTPVTTASSQPMGGDAEIPRNGTDTEDFINTVNAEKFGGHSDWRIPTADELISITDLGRYSPAIDTDYFPNTVSSYYWSSTTYADNTDYAWGAYFSTGMLTNNYRDNYRYVRAVRGGQTGSLDHLVINSDGTVSDASTGLMWQQAETENKMTWEAAMSHCESLSLAGYTDWRLPNQEELRSIVDYTTYNPAIDTDYFPNTVSSYHWSSTTYAYNTDNAWLISFGGGYDYPGDKLDPSYVRAVRGGQVRLLDHLIISAPSQGSDWSLGDGMNISWDTQSISGNVKISISRQGGKDGTFETIVESSENDGAYNWTVGGQTSVNCVLKIEPINDTSMGTTQGLFTIDGGIPTVTTTAAFSITATTATSGGNVTSEGGASVTARGVCWGTSANPTTSDHKTTNGTGTGSYSSSIIDLSARTTYHVRAYATNSVGTAYGNDVTFTTSYSFTRYVSSNGYCGVKFPCYISIQTAINTASTGSVILIANGIYNEDIILNADKSLTLQGGWDSTFEYPTGSTTLRKAPKAPQGSLTLQKMTIQP